MLGGYQINSSISFLGIYSGEIKALSLCKTCMQIFKVAQNWKQLKCPSTVE